MNFAAAIVPGAREPGMLTTFGATSQPTIPEGASTIDAVTIAEHQRAGGGAPSQRRPRRAPGWWTGASGRLHEFFLPMRVLLARRFRPNV